jgi:hypothetical protein
MPISTFPRHDDYEDQFLLKPAGLRDTHSEGKVRQQDRRFEEGRPRLFEFGGSAIGERGFEPPTPWSRTDNIY